MEINEIRKKCEEMGGYLDEDIGKCAVQSWEIFRNPAENISIEEKPLSYYNLTELDTSKYPQQILKFGKYGRTTAILFSSKDEALDYISFIRRDINDNKNTMDPVLFRRLSRLVDRLEPIKVTEYYDL
jgi:hypothetical protein